MPARTKWGVFRKLDRSFLEGLEESQRPCLGFVWLTEDCHEAQLSLE